MCAQGNVHTIEPRCCWVAELLAIPACLHGHGESDRLVVQDPNERPLGLWQDRGSGRTRSKGRHTARSTKEDGNGGEAGSVNWSIVMPGSRGTMADSLLPASTTREQKGVGNRCRKKEAVKNTKVQTNTTGQPSLQISTERPARREGQQAESRAAAGPTGSSS